jgi:2-hydroxychromene-2-carboxylate isomerase
MSHIDFYFDFSSPYGYLASTQLDQVVERHGCSVGWHPFLVGTAMKLTGRQPLAQVPMIGDYMSHDVARYARLLGVPWRRPDRFPVGAVAASRAYYWIREHHGDRAVAFAKSVYRAYFADNVDITDAKEVAIAAASQDIDPAELLAALGGEEVRQMLRQENDRALARGVFGSPFFIVGEERFWGVDRLDQVEHWLRTGGW